jgi:hypothetical protein
VRLAQQVDAQVVSGRGSRSPDLVVRRRLSARMDRRRQLRSGAVSWTRRAHTESPNSHSPRSPVHADTRVFDDATEAIDAHV